MLIFHFNNLTSHNIGSKGTLSSDYKQESAEWSSAIRSRQLLEAVQLGKWLLLYTQRDQRVAQDFVQTLLRVAGPLGT